jgi:RNA polymerase sigma-70 factor (ECF subfamily)
MSQCDSKSTVTVASPPSPTQGRRPLGIQTGPVTAIPPRTPSVILDVECVRQHDDDSVRAIYQRYRAPLTSYVLHAVADDYHYAEDIVQETMLRAWQHRTPLDAQQPGPWLYTVAHNLIVSEHRRRAVRPTEVPIEEQDFPTLTDEIDRFLQRWQIADALRTLREEHRTVLLQLFYHRRTVSEAARELGIPLGTVKSRSFYALRALRAALERRGVISR